MQEKYYVLDSHNSYYEFNSWYKLIKFLRKYDLKTIGHNFNDTYSITTFDHNRLVSRLISVDFVIFDSLWRVVDKSILKEAFDNFIYERKRSHLRNFRYRIDPVPGTSWGGRSRRIFKKIKRNKSYAARLQEYYSLFPNDGKMRQRKWLVKTCSDELYQRGQYKSWKHNTNKKKQWMKHI